MVSVIGLAETRERFTRQGFWHRTLRHVDCRKGNESGMAAPTRIVRRGDEPGCMSEAATTKFEGMDVAVLSRIVIPFMMVSREEIGGIRGLSREFCEVPFPPGARVVQAEKTEGAWIVWYVERVEAI